MQAFVDEVYSLTLDLLIEGEYASFDVGQTSYTIYDNSGTIIPYYQNITITTLTGQNQITLDIPEDVHTVADGKNFERRTVIVKTKVDGKVHTIRESYYVTPYLNYSVTENDVIALIGIREGEILKPDIDLVSAYLRVLDMVGASLTAVALSSGDIRQIKINDAIKAQAALALVHTIELRALKKLGSDSLSYTRFDGINFNQLRQNLAGILQEAILDSQGLDLSPITAFTVTAPIDPVTGV